MESSRKQQLPGIICRYVSSEKGILGVLKDSCDDFIVQEVDEEGQVVELIDTSEPKGKIDAKISCLVQAPPIETMEEGEGMISDNS